MSMVGIHEGFRAFPRLLQASAPGRLRPMNLRLPTLVELGLTAAAIALLAARPLLVFIVMDVALAGAVWVASAWAFREGLRVLARGRFPVSQAAVFRGAPMLTGTAARRQGAIAVTVCGALLIVLPGVVGWMLAGL